MDGDIIKVAIFPIINKKLLMCRKRGLDFLVNLGGTMEEGETDIECAQRETLEEARCGITNLRYFDVDWAPRQDEIEGQIELRCYFGDLVGEPTVNPKDKIYGFVWIDRNWEAAGHKLPESLKQKIMSRLIREGYL